MDDEAVDMHTGAGLDSSSAMVRAESAQLKATLSALVTRLSSVPGLELTVSRRHGRLRRLIGDLPYVNDLHRSSDPIDRLVVSVARHTYSLHAHEDSIVCTRELDSIERGPVKERLTFSAWALALFDDISQQNFANHESLVALRHLVERDQVQVAESQKEEHNAAL